MFETLAIQSSRSVYHVEFSIAADFLENRMSTSDIVLIDDTVMSLHPTMIPDPFPHERVLSLRPTEHLKTYLQIGSIIEQILDLGITKSKGSGQLVVRN